MDACCGNSLRHANICSDKRPSDREQRLAIDIDYINRPALRGILRYHYTHSSHNTSNFNIENTHSNDQDIRTRGAHIKMTIFTHCDHQEIDYDITGDEEV